MISQIDNWGNGLGIHIKKSYAKQLGWERGTQIIATIENEKLIIKAVKKPRPTLDDLIARITPENLHGEYDLGPAIGYEVW